MGEQSDIYVHPLNSTPATKNPSQPNPKLVYSLLNPRGGTSEGKIYPLPRPQLPIDIKPSWVLSSVDCYKVDLASDGRRWLGANGG
jgi:hypothetical protein